MPRAGSAPEEPRGWGIRLSFLGHTLAQIGAGDAAPVTVGEHKGCDLVLPGLGERAVLTDGATLVVLPGLVGEVHVGDRTRPVDAGRVPLSPGDRATLRLAAHPDVTLEVQRVTREHLPWSARVPLRDLVRQLVTGAALVAMVALLWRVEQAENLLKLRGDPTVDADSVMFRVMFAPSVEPVEVVQARELFRPPPLAPAPVEPGEDPLDAGPVALAFAPEDAALAVEAAPEHADQPPVEAATPSKRVRKRAQQKTLSLSALDAASLDRELVALSAFGGAVELPADMPDGAGPLVHVPKDMSRGAVGEHSHAAAGADATHGELDGLAAAVSAASCPDPEVVRKDQLDVVFVVDVSTTMNFMLDKIGREIAAVDAAARAHNLDARYGLVVFVDDVKVTHGGQPFADLAGLQQELAAWQGFTASNRQVGSPQSNVDWPENTLDALHAAASEFDWRPAATTLRAIIHATDDDFGEAPAVQSGQPVRHSYRQTVQALRAREVRVFSFAAKVGGQCECLDVRAGLFTPYRGQKPIPAATGGAVFDIDAVASGALNFGAAVSGALQTAVCAHYPLKP